MKKSLRQLSEPSINEHFLEILSWYENKHDAVESKDLLHIDRKLLDLLISAGLITEYEPSSTVECDGCEMACTMDVHFPEPKKAVVSCDKRNDIGLVHIDFNKLRRWKFSLKNLANTITNYFETPDNPKEIIQERLWLLPKPVSWQEPVDIFLARGINWQDANVILENPQIKASSLPVILVTDESSQDYKVPSLHIRHLVSVSNKLHFKSEPIKIAALAGKSLKENKVTAEIRCEGRKIMLINSAGSRKILSEPQESSAIGRIFDYLYGNPGKTFNLDNIKKELNISSNYKPAKIAERLGFKGNAKAFMETTKNTIKFIKSIKG